MAKDETGDQGEAFLREVDEELRRDQMAGLWRRYGRWLLIGIGAFLIALAAFLYWQEERREKVNQQSDRLARALTELDAGNTDKALPELKALAGSGTDGIKALARLAEAAQLVRGDEKPEAIKAYEAIAADQSLAKPFRDLAAFRAVQLQYDSMKPEEAVEKLKPLAQDGTPWFGPAGELLAVAYIDSGQPQLARALFEAIAGNEDVAPSLRGRASQMLTMLPETAAEAASAAATEAAPEKAASEKAAPEKAAPAAAPSVSGAPESK
ncbi:tetratricopeptide repeat protein [Pedomonas mirosovicensis]|uniref:tetratricopeptide repeat protein n=1 Tax=Pedomonas mirosovicensis TaxID=2908641 RepID=UPI0021672F81|nr:tetratricopeptide repeat protein [Pedomonas mirosovicensis]MCH8684484.1 tetratricopeptide repeat protein [Pedomonas mirosovicensis]